MDIVFLQVPSIVVLFISALAFAGAAYALQQFNKRIAPTIPYAGEGSLIERLQAPLEFVLSQDPVAFLCKARKKYGDVFCIDFFLLKVVYMLGPEANKALMRSTEEQMSFLKTAGSVLGPAIDWMRDKKFGAFGMKVMRLGLGKQDRLDGYLASCKSVAESFFERWAKQGTVPLFESMSHITVAVLVTIFFGPEFFKRHGEELIPMVEQFEQHAETRLLRLLPPSFWRFTPAGRALLGICARMDELISEELRNLAAAEKNGSFIEDPRNDYFGYLIKACGGPLDTRFVKHYTQHMLLMLVAGRANTASAISWLYLHARRHPTAIARMKDEIMAKPRGRTSAGPLPFLDACMRETGRFYANVPLPRITNDSPVNILGYEIPPHTLISISPLAMQRAGAGPEYDSGPDKVLYVKAGSWLPERFLADNGRKYLEWFKRHEFMLFGTYHHACPGEKITRMLVFDCVLATWLEQYELEVVNGLEEGKKGIDGVGIEPDWFRDNLGTPCGQGDVTISVKKRATA